MTVVEWGAGLAEQLSETRLELTITGDDVRTATCRVGDRWDDVSTPSRPPADARGVRTGRRAGIRPRVRGPVRARIA